MCTPTVTCAHRQSLSVWHTLAHTHTAGRDMAKHKDNFSIILLSSNADTATQCWSRRAEVGHAMQTVQAAVAHVVAVHVQMRCADTTGPQASCSD